MFFLKHKVKNISLGENQKVVLVVGGSGVLGKALFWEKPGNYFFINASRRSEIVGEDVFNYHMDLLGDIEKSIKLLSKHVSKVDILVNAACYEGFTSIAELNKENFLRELEIDVFAPVNISMLCAKYFWATDGMTKNIRLHRKVINISSGAAFGKTSRPEVATYGAAKAALDIMTTYLHDYLFGNFGVSAHLIAPGAFSDKDILGRTVKEIWNLSDRKQDSFSLAKIF